MALIKHHRFDISQGVIVGAVNLGVQHIAEYFRGHHHDARFPIDAEITGQQANILSTKLAAKIAQFLVR